jgi:hypothetical protein
VKAPIALVVCGIAPVVAGCHDSPPAAPRAPAKFTIPAASEVKRIHVSDATQERPLDREFDIVDHFEPLLDAFRDNELEPNPAAWAVWCDLTIELNDRGRLRLTVFKLGGKHLAFRAGNYYRGGSSELLQDALRSHAPK